MSSQISRLFVFFARSGAARHWHGARRVGLAQTAHCRHLGRAVGSRQRRQLSRCVQVRNGQRKTIMEKGIILYHLSTVCHTYSECIAQGRRQAVPL